MKKTLTALLIALLLVNPNVGFSGPWDSGGGSSGGSGDVTSADSITDNAVVRGNGGSKGVQGSLCTIDDSGQMTCPDGFVAGASSDPGTAYNVATSGDTDWWLGVNGDAGGDDDDPLEFRLGSSVAGTLLAWLSRAGVFYLGATAGVGLSQTSAGKLVVQGFGGTNNESLTIDGETTADRVLISTPSAVSLFLSAHPTNESARISLNDAAHDYVGFERSLVAFNQPLSTTIADNGAGTAATSALTAFRSYMNFVCNDSDGCEVTFGETNVPSGAIVYVRNNGSSNSVTIKESANVVDIGGDKVLTGQDDMICLLYMGTEWNACSPVVDN